MPSLQFKGKSIIWNYHLTTPYYQLKPSREKSVLESSKGKPSLEDSLIIHGDNLLAIKALLPHFSSKVKCIYIDPPYNTGNEKWVYNDNVSHPLFKDWLKKTVDREDLTRHDKWLCMMTPRLKLLRELLRDDGVIFISIDDNEAHRLRALMDEVFGEENFVACIAARLNPRGRTLDRFVAKTHEHILLYGKDVSHESSINLLDKDGAAVEDYDKTDERGIYRELELRNRNPVFTRQNRPNLFYPFYVDPKTGETALEISKKYSLEVFPRNSKSEDGCWTWGKEKSHKQRKELLGRKVSTGEWRIYRKDYLYDDDGDIATTKAKALWLERNINNENGKEIVSQIFGNVPFDFPKSVELVKKCLLLGTRENDLVLDSFAGSGTTAHAVLALNAEDGGNRKFILIEQEDYADDVTAERVRRVINGVKKAKDDALQRGYGGTFSYMTLGKPLQDEAMLKGKALPDYLDLARYVYFTATGEQLDESHVNESKFYLGESKHYSVYMIYKPDVQFLKNTPLSLDFAQKLPKSDKPRLIIASHKYLDEDYMLGMRLEFCQLPFGVYKFRA